MSKRRYLAFALAVAAGLLLLGWFLYGVPGSGFGEYTGSVDAENRAKTLWDWLDLFVIPLALAAGLWWLNRQERESERALALNRQRENALQAYLDRMTELLLKESLRGSDEDAEVRSVARSRTLTALRQLDGDRKGMLLRFLMESGLISRENAIVDVTGADLSDVNLRWTDLRDVGLRDVNLREADLRWAVLGGTDLCWADLSASDLRLASLAGADLNWAKLTDTQLKDANLSGADLRCADLCRTDLRSADLHEADLREAKLRGADLHGADLRDAKLRWTDLSEASLVEASLLGAKYNDKTRWPSGFDPEEAGAIKVED